MATEKPKEKESGGGWGIDFSDMDWMEAGVYIVILIAFFSFVVPRLLSPIVYLRDRFCTEELCGSPVNLNEREVYSQSGASLYGDLNSKEGFYMESGVLGTVSHGPQLRNGENFWYVDFQLGEDGWVKESDLKTKEAEVINNIIFYFKIISAVLSTLLILGIGYLIAQIRKLEKIELKKLYPLDVDKSIPKISDGVVNQRWKTVLEHIGSSNQNDWKVSILEADIILDEMLDRMGYKGETLGEKLKKVEESDFLSINSAWEAHKIRNQIAHQGAEFLISHDEAKRIVGLYKQVFEEFYYI